MKIKVLYPNGIGFVDPDRLNTLIAKGEIMAFYRSDKLVVVGVHKTRTNTAVEGWPEPDRRSGTNG